ncbi:hypothetical protein DY000_02061224 [Brassica cretica]|uniref:Uncharacterized protein n=1 Tax=Brassica cretica TaxID=69181 RepID=A0ABQ7AXT4_BRACR|nr:hypothetical protein DY000_02061224 [Brassica cretica]
MTQEKPAEEVAQEAQLVEEKHADDDILVTEVGDETQLIEEMVDNTEPIEQVAQVVEEKHGGSDTQPVEEVGHETQSVEEMVENTEPVEQVIKDELRREILQLVRANLDKEPQKMELKTTENQTKGKAMNQVDGKYEAPLEEKEIDTTAFLQKYKKLTLIINEH